MDSCVDSGLCFTIMFMPGLVGLGQYTKRGAGLIIQSIIGDECLSPVSAIFEMLKVTGNGGACTCTNNATHISKVVPMTAYSLCTVFCYNVLFEERHHNIPPSVEKDEQEQEVPEEILEPTIKVTGDTRLHS